jgi:hypothetical protein
MLTPLVSSEIQAHHLMLEDLTADGAMYQLPMKMDMRVPDVLMLEMTHGTVVINMIPLLAHQDGLVMKKLTNALWLTQVMDSEVNQPVTNSAKFQAPIKPTDIDAILLPILAKNVRLVQTLVAIKIELLHAQLHAKMEMILLNSLNATKLTQINQNARNVKKDNHLDVKQEVRPVNNAHQSQNYSNVIKRL